MNKGLQLPVRENDEGIHPKVCVPLVGNNYKTLQQELEQLTQTAADIFEWRVDHFDHIAEVDTVVQLAEKIHRETKRPLLFTRRSEAEGGQANSLNEEQVMTLYEALIKSATVHGVDIEMRRPEKEIHHLREQANKQGIDVVLSYHNFIETPPARILEEKVNEAVELGADVAKIAVMPESKGDALTLLQVTEKISRVIPIPLISMAMGANGMISRLAGGVFGSALTFAAGVQSSAPGQLPVTDVEQVLRILDRNM